jgi:hypothetical protein
MTHGINKKEFRVFSAEEFIAESPSISQTSIFRWQGTATNIRVEAGEKKSRPTSSAVTPALTVLDVSDHQPRRVPSETWQELIKRDPLSRPRCDHEIGTRTTLTEFPTPAT